MLTAIFNSKHKLGWVHLAVLLQETLQTRHHKTLESDWCTFIGSSEWQWHRWHYFHVTQWNDNTNCHPTVLVVRKLTWVPSGLAERHAKTIQNLPHWSFTCTSCWKLYNSWWKRQLDIITSTWTHWTKDGPHCLMRLFRKCVWQLLCRSGMNWGTCWSILRGRVQKLPVCHTKTAPNGNCCKGYIAASVVRLTRSVTF
jgi:hypothetical protein